MADPVTYAKYLKIPMSPTQHWYSFRIALSQAIYTLDIRYNIRVDRWILSIYDSAQNPIVMGLPLLVGRDIIGQYATLALPPGPLFCVDDSGKGLQPALSSFLLTHRFIYAEP